VGDFGDKFRKAREKKELSLDDVSNVTKISARMLRAIEEEHFEDLPGGVFNKGFIRAYSKHLGLDAEEAVTDYLATLRQAQIDSQEVWEPPTGGDARSAPKPGKPRAPEDSKAAVKPSGKPAAPVQVEELPDLQLPRAEDVRPARSQFSGEGSSGIPWKIVGAAALVFALGIFLWVRHSNRAAASSHAEVAASAAPAQAASVATLPPATPAPAGASNMTSPTQASVAASSQPAAAQPLKSASADHGPDDPKDVTVKNFEKPAASPSQKSAPALSLIIRATENSWISVFSDGQLVTQETLIAPAHTSVRASREISIRVGNAAGVSFSLNGQEIPAQGGEAEVKNFTFDSAGMHVGTATQTP